MAKLTDLCFSKGTIFETIISTYNPDGTADAAPMGVTMQAPQTISLNLYNSSQTCRNIKAKKCAVINLTVNIEVFYKTTFKEVNPNGKLPQEWFEKEEAMNAPKLRSSNASVAVSVIEMEPVGAEKTNFSCKVERIDGSKVYPQVYCRAMAATLEAIIHATRVKLFLNQKTKQKDIIKLLELIENSNDIVNRTAPNSAYSSIMADLTKRIDGWRNKP
jgi:uncharacterized protein